MGLDEENTTYSRETAPSPAATTAEYVETRRNIEIGILANDGSMAAILLRYSTSG
jgi:hypothetical protein